MDGITGDHPRASLIERPRLRVSLAVVRLSGRSTEPRDIRSLRTVTDMWLRPPTDPKGPGLCWNREQNDLQLLTVMEKPGLVPVLPRASEATLLSVYVPLGTLVVSHWANQP